MNEWIISTDIAKAYDRTTIGVFQKRNEKTEDGRSVSYLLWRDLKMEEQMPYMELGRYMCRLDMHTTLHGNNDLIVDSTGVGEAVCDIFEEMGLSPERIIFTGGEKARVRTESKGFGGFAPRRTINVPKTELIDTLKLAVEQRRMRISPGIAFEKDIKDQFSHFIEMKTRTKKTTYGNDNPEVHDDIVISAAMAVWYFLRQEGAMGDFRYNTDTSYSTVAMLRKGREQNEMADYDFESTL